MPRGAGGVHRQVELEVRDVLGHGEQAREQGPVGGAVDGGTGAGRLGLLAVLTGGVAEVGVKLQASLEVLALEPRRVEIGLIGLDGARSVASRTKLTGSRVEC